MAWETFPHEADIGLHGTGLAMAEDFAGAALAMMAVIHEPASVTPHEEVKIECSVPAPEMMSQISPWMKASFILLMVKNDIIELDLDGLTYGLFVDIDGLKHPLIIH
jgi:SHS2 domain-containing protein